MLKQKEETKRELGEETQKELRAFAEQQRLENDQYK